MADRLRARMCAAVNAQQAGRRSSLQLSSSYLSKPGLLLGMIADSGFQKRRRLHVQVSSSLPALHTGLCWHFSPSCIWAGALLQPAALAQCALLSAFCMDS